MAEIADWSPVDESNNSAPPVGAPEMMAPSAVNNTMRAMMGSVRRWYDTVTTQLTTYLPLAGGTITGSLGVAGSLSVGDIHMEEVLGALHVTNPTGGGGIGVDGPNGGYVFGDRDGVSAPWLLYANAGTAHLLRSDGADIITASWAGQVWITGNLAVSGNQTVNGSLAAASLSVSGSLVGNTIHVNSITSNGDISAASFSTAGAVTAASISVSGGIVGNTVNANSITANGLLSANSISVSDDVGIGGDVAANTVTANAITSNGNITAAGQISAAAFVASGNATVAGTATVGNVSASGTVSTNVLTAVDLNVSDDVVVASDLAVAGTSNLTNVNIVGGINAIGNDSNFFIRKTGGEYVINFEPNTYLMFNAATNNFSIVIDGVTKASW